MDMCIASKKKVWICIFYEYLSTKRAKDIFYALIFIGEYTSFSEQLQ